MRRPKISVIVPIYNVEEYLGKCLSSVIGQTYTNLEIICVDDGSSDSSGAILDQFAARDSRIVAIHQPNGGVSTARNTALDRCTGDFIGFVDGDDWVEPDMYEVLISNITANDVDISACGYFVDEEGASTPVVNLLPVPEEPMDIRDFLKYIYIRDKYRGVAAYLFTRLFRRVIFCDDRIQFDSNLHVGEDQFFIAQCFLSGRRHIYTKRNLYHYIQRKGSAMHDARRRLSGLGSCVAFQRVIDLYEEYGIEPYVVDYVKRFYVYHASVLLKMALEYNDVDKIEILNENIQKYLDIYRRTNMENPERVEEVQRLLELTACDGKCGSVKNCPKH